MTSEKQVVLFVDDEERILRSLELGFRNQYRVLVANGGHQALALLAEESIDVIVSDQRMPNMTGVEVLRAARDITPATMRILLTGYAELTGIIGSINDGEIFRYVQKPWQLDELRKTVGEAALIAKNTASVSTATANVSMPDTTIGVIVLDQAHDLAIRLRNERPLWPIRHAVTLDQALSQMEEYPTGVLITDLAMAHGKIRDALQLLKSRHPELVVIATTTAADTTDLITLINKTQVYRVLPRPVGKNMLIRSVESALRHHNLLLKRPEMKTRHRVDTSHVPLDSDFLSRIRQYLGRLKVGT